MVSDYKDYLILDLRSGGKLENFPRVWRWSFVFLYFKKSFLVLFLKLNNSRILIVQSRGAASQNRHVKWCFFESENWIS